MDLIELYIRSVNWVDGELEGCMGFVMDVDWKRLELWLDLGYM